MDDKRNMQRILNRSLSGLQENPFLARRVIDLAKGEKPVKRKLSLALILCIVLVLALLGTACALLASSQVADFFRQYWNHDLGDWLQQGKLAQPGDSVTIGDVSFTVDEVVYRNRELFGIGTARPANGRDVLVPMDLADAWDLYSREKEGQELIRQAAAAGGRLLAIETDVQEIGVDGGTMLPTEYTGAYNIRNEDGSITFSFETGGTAVEDGTTYQMKLNHCVYELTPEGGQKEDSFVDRSWTLAFTPETVAETTAAEAAPVSPAAPPQDGYELIVPDEYRETGTLPFYQAAENDFSRVVRPEWFNRTGILKEESAPGSAYYVFSDHAALSVDPEAVSYSEYTDEPFDYNWRAREIDDPDLEPAWGDKPAFSASIAAVASFVNWSDDFAKDAVLTKRQLTRLSFADAEAAAKNMLDQLQLSGYELSWALDMDLDRIRTLGKAYNEHWYESGSAFTDAPRYDYDPATAEDEGYYLIYTQAGTADAGAAEGSASFFITCRGIVSAQVRCSFIMGEKAGAPASLITPEKALERLYEEIAASRNGEKAVAIRKAELTHMPLRAENKQEGMLFTPVWVLTYVDEAGEKKGFDSWAVFNAVNGKLVDAVFQ